MLLRNEIIHIAHYYRLFYTNKIIANKYLVWVKENYRY